MKIVASFNQFPRGFRVLALGQGVYLLAVILYGAMVRATLSGAGCGAHWPLCNGEWVPQVNQWSTLIELGHRITSGLCLPLALGVAWWARRYRHHHPGVFYGAIATVVLVMVEALVGASLVLLEHVAQNTSGYRAISLSVHLLSSNFLLAFALLTWQLSLPRAARRSSSPGERRGLWAWVSAGAGMILVTNFSGAFTVLADTLFPSPSLADSLAASLLATKHIFVRMRIVHPFIAMFSGGIVLWCAHKVIGNREALRIFAKVILAALLVQGLLGLSNILWAGTLFFQLAHLFMAEVLWLSFIGLSMEGILPETVNSGGKF